jgi:hypothetical protein
MCDAAFSSNSVLQKVMPLLPTSDFSVDERDLAEQRRVRVDRQLAPNLVRAGQA